MLLAETRKDQEQGGGDGLSFNPTSEDIKPHIIMGSHSWMDCLTAELFLGNCFSDIVFVTVFRTAVETAIRGVHKLLGTGGVPASLTLLFWRWLTMSSVFTGRRARTSYS